MVLSGTTICILWSCCLCCVLCLSHFNSCSHCYCFFFSYTLHLAVTKTLLKYLAVIITYFILTLHPPSSLMLPPLPLLPSSGPSIVAPTWHPGGLRLLPTAVQGGGFGASWSWETPFLSQPGPAVQRGLCGKQPGGQITMSISADIHGPYELWGTLPSSSILIRTHWPLYCNLKQYQQLYFHLVNTLIQCTSLSLYHCTGLVPEGTFSCIVAPIWGTK